VILREAYIKDEADILFSVIPIYDLEKSQE